MFPSLHKMSQSHLDNLISFVNYGMTQKIKLSGDSNCCSDECCSPDTPKQEIKEKIKDMAKLH